MSTATSSLPRAKVPSPSLAVHSVIPGEQRIVIRDLTWDLYDKLSDAIDERQHVRLTYDGRDLEIMTTGPPRTRAFS